MESCIVNHKAAAATLYHIEQLDRRLKLLRTYINAEEGTVSNMRAVSGIALDIDEDSAEIRNNLVKFL